jgi:natural product precursor
MKSKLRIGRSFSPILNNLNIQKMKKLSLVMLRLTSDEVLDRSQMKKITGGYDFQCHCGFVGGASVDDPFLVSTHTIEQALQRAASQCNGMGATCEGA